MENQLQSIHHNTLNILETLKKRCVFPSVMIFHGPKTQEKESYALSLINRVVNPNKDKELENRIIQKIHPDVQVFSCQDQEQFALGTVKNWVEEASLPPFELNQKWVVIDDAEKLTTIHCNTLLKTLEEPTHGMHFILIVENLNSLMDTVISRAIKIPFFPLSIQTIAKNIPLNEEQRPNFSFTASLLAGSYHLLSLVRNLEEINYFQSLHQIFLYYLQKKIPEGNHLLEELEKLLLDDQFNKKNMEIYEITFSYFLFFLKRIGEKDPTIFRKIPKAFQLNNDVIMALKRHVKLKNCLEQLAILL